MKHVADMVAAANAVVEHAPAAEFVGLHGDPDVTFVDLRDPRELERDGMIPGAYWRLRQKCLDDRQAERLVSGYGVPVIER